MHTTRAETTTFHRNGDYSGPVYFRVASTAVLGRENEVPATEVAVMATFPDLVRAAAAAGAEGDLAEVEVTGEDVGYRDRDGAPTFRVRVPVLDLRALVGQRVVEERISKLEQMGYADAYALALEDEVATWSAEGE